MADLAELNIGVGADTRGLRSDFDKVPKMAADATDEVESKFEAMGGKLKKVTGTAMAGVGVALAAGAAAGGALFVNRFFDAVEKGKLSDKLAAQLDLDPREAERAAKLASDIYAGAWGDSLGEVNDAIRGVAQELVDLETASDDTVRGLTTGALDVATAFDQDVNEVIRTAGLLFKNDLAPDAQTALDIITKGFQTGANRSDDFLETLNEYAEPLSSLGIDGGKALRILNEGLDDGVFNADKLMDAVKEFSIRVVETDTPDVIQAFGDMNLSAVDLQSAIAEGGPVAQEATGKIITALLSMDDPLEREKTGVALFGAMWEDVGGDVILNALDPMKAGIEDVEGATVKMGDTLNDNVATDIESFKRKAGEAMTNWVHGNVLPGAQSVMDAFSEDGVGGAMDEALRLWQAAQPKVEAWFTGTVMPWFEDTLVPWMGFVGGKMAEGLAQALIDGIAAAAPSVASAIADHIMSRIDSMLGPFINFGGGRAEIVGGIASRTLPTPNIDLGGSRPGVRGGRGGTIRAFHDGGVVAPELARGTEVWARLLAGETVLPTHRLAASADRMARAALPGLGVPTVRTGGLPGVSRSIGGGSQRPLYVTLKLDSRILAEGLLEPLGDEVEIRTGVGW